MKSSLLFGISRTAIIIFSILVFGSNVKASEYVPGEILVKYKDLTRTSSINSLHSRVGSVRKKEFTKIRVEHVKLPSYMSVEEAVEYYRLDPNVEYAEPNYIVHAAVLPNDTLFSNLWGLNNTGQSGGTSDADIDAPEAWDKTQGSNSVIIAVIDTGVAYNHPDLIGNIWTNTGEIPGNAIDDDGNGYIDDIYGWDFVDGDGYPEDFNSHGTHVAGTIAARGNNGSGITGVMWNARIMAIRFLGLTGSGTTANAISAILYAKTNGAHIINNSWGGDGYSQALKDAIDAFPGIVVCAAGNVSGDNDGTAPFYPASYNSPNIIAVAATDHNDSLASFSNYGATSVDLAAPGVSIYSNIPKFSYGPPVTLYSENFDGSSGSLPRLGWSRGGTNSTWAITAGTGEGGTNSLEDSPGGTYLNNTLSWAGYMTLVTSVKNNRYTLMFQWKGDLEGNYDYLFFNYSLDSVNWYPIDDYSITGSSGGGGFVQYSADFTPVADSFDQFYFGFGLDTDSSITGEGVFIDNVILTREPISVSGYNYDYYQGTSMAAPHVSGVAGLILANNPTLAYYQVKVIILNSVDSKASLSGKVLTGGRLNANNAVLNSTSPTMPTGLSATVVSKSQINLSWTDNANDETGFKIERRTGASGNFSEIASVGADVTSYPDTGLSQGTTYYYRVRVFGGSSGNFSYSNEDSATTSSAPSSSGGGGRGRKCFIATAAYGSVMHPYVKALREFRDNHLLTNAPGRAVIELYYRYSPPVADTIRDSESLRFITRLILTPLVMFVIFPYHLTGLLLILAVSGAVIKKSRNIRRGLE